MLFSILPTNTLSVRSTNNPFSNTPGILLIIISTSFGFLIPSLNKTSRIRLPWYQGNLILDVLFNDGIKNPKEVEMMINNIPGVLENGLFVDLTDKVLVGKIENNTPVVYSPSKAS